MNIIFNNSSAYKKGLIYDLLVGGYKDIPTTNQKDLKDFQKFSEEVDKNQQWLGKCVFITTVDTQPVGFVSFDPREKPVATIGHNVILPEYRGKSIGKKQMAHTLKAIKDQGFSKAVVSTCPNQHFVPAQKMYESCGFKKNRNFYDEKSGTEMIGYELVFDL